MRLNGTQLSAFIDIAAFIHFSVATLSLTCTVLNLVYFRLLLRPGRLIVLGQVDLVRAILEFKLEQLLLHLDQLLFQVVLLVPRFFQSQRILHQHRHWSVAFCVERSKHFKHIVAVVDLVDEELLLLSLDFDGECGHFLFELPDLLLLSDGFLL